jgi:hypothetical protein
MRIRHDSAKCFYSAKMQNDKSGRKPGTANKRKETKAPQASTLALPEMPAIPATVTVFSF